MVGTIPHESMGCYVYFIKHKNDTHAPAALTISCLVFELSLEHIIHLI